MWVDQLIIWTHKQKTPDCWITISRLLWAPFGKSEPFSLFKRPKMAMRSNFAAWFIINHEIFEKKKKKLLTIDLSQSKNHDFLAIQFFWFLWAPKS